MKLNHVLLAGVISTVAFSTVATAAPQIIFKGEVSGQTCTASINGETDTIVLLPTVSTELLANTGSTGGITPFRVTIKDCEPDSTDLAINTNFLGRNVTANGTLGNTADSANAAKNVSIQLMTSGSGSAPVDLSAGVTPVPGLVLKKDETSTSYEFGARYYSEGGATAGEVTSLAEYTLSYF